MPMEAGSWAATDDDSVIVAADPYREKVEIQHVSGNAMFLGFGVAGVVDKGIKMSVEGPYYQITDHRATLAIHAICDTGESASGGYQTA